MIRHVHRYQIDAIRHWGQRPSEYRVSRLRCFLRKLGAELRVDNHDDGLRHEWPHIHIDQWWAFFRTGEVFLPVLHDLDRRVHAMSVLWQSFLQAP